MNFLAHIYLSGEGDELLTIGNFIADTVRGKEYLQYPEAMQRGILLHREIDTFTDAHPVFRQSKHRLVPTYNHYAGVLVDIFYDYCLAKNWNQYSSESLERYAERFYNSLQRHQHLLSNKAQNLSKYIIAERWLESYQTVEGIASILYPMDRRTGFVSKMQYAAEDLQRDEKLYEEEFTQFFKEIQMM
ncbi:ACP phosphodiesterase [Capnocytophaga sp. HP1101]